VTSRLAESRPGRLSLECRKFKVLLLPRASVGSRNEVAATNARRPVAAPLSRGARSLSEHEHATFLRFDRSTPDMCPLPRRHALSAQSRDEDSTGPEFSTPAFDKNRNALEQRELAFSQGTITRPQRWRTRTLTQRSQTERAALYVARVPQRVPTTRGWMSASHALAQDRTSFAQVRRKVAKALQ
jgi:hypothetical protein